MLGQLNTLYPVRYTALALCAFGFLLSLFAVVGLGVGCGDGAAGDGAAAVA